MRISQVKLEHLLHTQHVEESIKVEISEDLLDQVKQCVGIYTDWLDTVKWQSHEYRKDAIRHTDKYAIVLKILTKITRNCMQGLPLVSIAGMINLSNDLDKPNNIQLSSDLIALLAPIGLYELSKSLGGTYVVRSLIQPSDELLRQIKLGCYLPPMIEQPEHLSGNDQSAYLTINKDSLILGGEANQHNGNISLDVLNTLNSNKYELDPFIIQQEKPWHREYLTPLDIYCLRPEDRDIYKAELRTRELYLEQFNYLKTLLVDRTIHFTHKIDKRGRVYTQGYHFNTQGTSFEKASINLKKRELITGKL